MTAVRRALLIVLLAEAGVVAGLVLTMKGVLQ